MELTKIDINRIWGKETDFKVFISHKSSFKKEASQLKKNLEVFGISCFVAHEDIEPNQEWQKEIEKAIFSADALIALMTKDFHDSYWTDQEIGIAYGRNIPIITIRLGNDPYGFIGKFQGFKLNLESDYLEIAKYFMKHPRMVDSYINRVENSDSFDISMSLSLLLTSIVILDENQIERLLKAYTENSQVSRCYGFIGMKNKIYGNGLKFELKRITGKDYILKSYDDYIDELIKKQEG